MSGHTRCPKCGLTFGKGGHLKPHKAKCGRMCAGGSAWVKEYEDGSEVVLSAEDMPVHHPDEKACDHPGCVRRRERSEKRG